MRVLVQLCAPFFWMPMLFCVWFALCLPFIQPVYVYMSSLSACLPTLPPISGGICLGGMFFVDAGVKIRLMTHVHTQSHTHIHTHTHTHSLQRGRSPERDPGGGTIVTKLAAATFL